MSLPFVPTTARTTLPIIPKEVLKERHVFERCDTTRLKSSARLLQSLWLERHQIPIGVHRSRDGRTRKLGSRLSTAAALAGRNFLSPALATLAHRMIAYQEPGALWDLKRTLENAMSSTGICCNLVGSFILDRPLGARVLRILLPDQDIDQIIDIRLEHSPLRGPKLSNKTSFDACIWFTRKRHTRHVQRVGVLAMEFKYTEALTECAAVPRGYYDDLAHAAGIYKDAGNALLRVAPLQQLFREHLLAQDAVMRGLWPSAVLASVAPAANERVQRQADLYQSFLNPTLEGQVPFVYLTLDAFVDALQKAHAPELAAAIFERYLDWGQIDLLVAEALKKRVANWSPAAAIKPPVELIRPPA
jgi:hypothetical protein